MVGMGRQRARTQSPRERAHRAEQGTLADSRPRASDEDSESATRIVIVRGYPKRANHGVQSPDTAPHTDLHFKSERASLAAARSGDRWGGDWPAGACGQARTRRRAALISVFGGRAFIVRWHTLIHGLDRGPLGRRAPQFSIHALAIHAGHPPMGPNFAASNHKRRPSLPKDRTALDGVGILSSSASRSHKAQSDGRPRPTRPRSCAAQPNLATAPTPTTDLPWA